MWVGRRPRRMLRTTGRAVGIPPLPDRHSRPARPARVLAGDPTGGSRTLAAVRSGPHRRGRVRPGGSAPEAPARQRPRWQGPGRGLVASLPFRKSARLWSLQIEAVCLRNRRLQVRIPGGVLLQPPDDHAGPIRRAVPSGIVPSPATPRNRCGLGPKKPPFRPNKTPTTCRQTAPSRALYCSTTPNGRCPEMLSLQHLLYRIPKKVG